MESIGTFSFFKVTLLKWAHAAFGFIPNLVAAIVVLWLCWMLTGCVRRASQRFYSRFFNGTKGLQHVINAVVIGFFWFVAAMFILDILNLTNFITHILAGAGILGIIGGFALKDIATNAFAGFLLKVQRPFEPDDWVNINGYVGQIHTQGLIMTGIRTVAGQMAWVPNQVIYNGTYLNYSTFGTCRVILRIGVSYGDDLAHVEKVALETVRALPMTIEPERADFYFTDIGSSTYNFEVRYWIRYTGRPDFLAATNAGIQAIKKAFEHEDISVAYNVTTLDFGVKGGVNLMDKPVRISLEPANVSGDAGKNGTAAGSAALVEAPAAHDPGGK